MLVYRAVFESESAPGCILVLLLVMLSVVCSRAVLCAGCRLAGCIVRGLRELSRQNIARWWIYGLYTQASTFLTGNCYDVIITIGIDVFTTLPRGYHMTP